MFLLHGAKQKRLIARQHRWSCQARSVKQKKSASGLLLIVAVSAGIIGWRDTWSHSRWTQNYKLAPAFASTDRLPDLDNTTRNVFDFLVSKVHMPFKRIPSRTEVDLEKALLEVNLKDPKDWSVLLIEKPENLQKQEEGEPHLTVAALDEEMFYSFVFDTATSRLKPPEGSGVQRFALGFTSMDHGNDVDWYTTIEANGQRIFATADNGTLVYDFGFHAQLNLTDKVSVDYMLDAKRRPNGAGPKFQLLKHGFKWKTVQPDYTRQGGRITVYTQFGDFILGVDEQDPDVAANDFPDHDFEYHVETPTIPGLEKIEFRVATENHTALYTTTMNFDSAGGLKNNLKIGSMGGHPFVDAEFGLHATLPAGINVSAQGTAVANEFISGFEISPVRVQAAVDLGERLPLIKAGSLVMLGARLNPATRDVEHPHGKLQFNMGAGPAKAHLKAKLEEDGFASSSLGVGANLGGVALAYQASVEPVNVNHRLVKATVPAINNSTDEVVVGSESAEEMTDSMDSIQQEPSIQHSVELKYVPGADVMEAYNSARSALAKLAGLSLPPGGASVWGRIMQNAKMHGGRPRLQLGVQYNLGRMTTEDVTFDSEKRDLDKLHTEADALHDHLASKAMRMKRQASGFLQDCGSVGPPSLHTFPAVSLRTRRAQPQQEAEPEPEPVPELNVTRSAASMASERPVRHRVYRSGGH